MNMQRNILNNQILKEEATKALSSSSSSKTDEIQEEETSDTPPVNTTRTRPRRGAVSAEVYNEDDITTYVKKVGFHKVWSLRS